MAVDNPEIRMVDDLFRYIEKLRASEGRPQEAYWCGMDRQKMLKREKELDLNEKSRRKSVIEKRRHNHYEHF